NLDVFQVPKKFWVPLALLKTPLDDRTEYRAWCTDAKKKTEEWDNLKEFLTTRYSGAVSKLDAFMSLLALPGPKSFAALDQFVDQFKKLAAIADFKDGDEKTAMLFISKMPEGLHVRMLSEATSASQLVLTSAIAQARSYFRAHLLSKPTAMSIDAVSMGSRARGLPPYSLFASWVTRKEYDDRAAANACLGCGKKHIWRDCDRYPKGQQN
ncbi:hypothetical protein GGI12_005297, partial [Dipsacomyces acuminosporus]